MELAIIGLGIIAGMTISRALRIICGVRIMYAVKNGNEFITAPSGWMRAGNTVIKDGTDPKKSGPEMGKVPYLFESKKYAEQQCAKLINGTIVEW